MSNTLVCKDVHPRASKISSFLFRFYAEHKTRITMNSFINDAIKSCMSSSEAKTLFEYYLNRESCMKPSLTSTRVYSFTCSQEHFNSVAVSEVLKQCNIKDKDPRRGSKVPEIKNPTIITKVVEKPILIQSEPKQEIVYKDKDYSMLSVSEIDKEIQKLKALRDRKNEAENAKRRIRIEYNLNLSKVDEYCRKLGCNRKDLQNVLTKIINVLQAVIKTEKEFPFVKSCE